MLYLELRVPQTLHAGPALGLGRQEQWFHWAEPVIPQRLTGPARPGKQPIRTRRYGDLHAEKPLQRRHKRFSQPIMPGRPTLQNGH